MRALHLAPVIALAGCYSPAPQAGAPCNERGECPTGLRCIADLCQSPDMVPEDAAIDVAIDVCPELSCIGNDLAGCNSRMTCSLGCADAVGTTPAHCLQMVPSNGLTTALLAGATADVSGLDLDFDTETGVITHAGGMPLRAAGTGVIAGIGFTVIDKMGVFTANSFFVDPITDSANDWDARGDNALVLFAATTITVHGRIDNGANGVNGGAGGAAGATSGSNSLPCRGRAGLWQMANFGEGGGGGGGRATGGNGAPSNTTTFGAGGQTCSAPTGGPTTIPLRGGNGGGAGGVETAPSPDVIRGGAGGGGGGALALVAMESITISGEATAPGEGGRTSATGDGGGGGGSGGAILVEAPVVTISGAVTANGGGGAAPNTANGSRGHVNDSSQASGGVYMTASGGRGGTGAAPTAGTTYTDGTMARGGGGGGAGGRTELKGRTRNTAGSVISPGAVQNDIAVE
ncbi:MAG: hypothetical protein H0T46_05030 [Deltaproteobacteria bacterium]|nr:hypothetical protein [Deltaproteobacteria bacterium]